MSGLVLAWRLTRRQLIRDWWRVALGGLLVGSALTLSALGFATLADRSEPEVVAIVGQPSAPLSRHVNVTYGPGPIRIDGPGGRLELGLPGFGSAGNPAPRPPAVHAPAGSKVTVARATRLRLRAGDRQSIVVVADASGDVAEQMLALEDGRRPTGNDEIALTRSNASRLKADRGALLRVVGGPLAGRQFRVVGTVTPIEGINGDVAVVTPEVFDGVPVEGRMVAVDRPGGFGGGGTSSSTSGTSSASGRLQTSYWVNEPAEGGASIGALALYSLLFALVPLALPLLATGALLAVGLERRSRERRLLEQAGAPGWLVRAPALVEGAAIGLVAAAVALAVARLLDHRIGVLGVVLPVVVIGFVAGIYAGTAADRNARRLAREAARPVAGVPAVVTRGLVILPVVVLVATVIASVNDGGRWGIPPWLALLIVAVCFIPLLTTLAASGVRLMARFAPTPAARVSLGASARSRWLSTPAAGLIALASVALVGIVSIVRSDGTAERTDRVTIEADAVVDSAGRPAAPREAVERMVAGLPVATIVPLRRLRPSRCAVNLPPGTPVSDGPTDPGLYLFDRAAATALFGAGDVAPSAAGVVGFGNTSDPGTLGCPGQTFSLRWISADVPVGSPHLFATPRFAATAGLTPEPAPVWVAMASSGSFSSDDLRALRRAADDEGLQLTESTPRAEGGFNEPHLDTAALALFVFLGAIALILAAVERRPERRQLHSAGVGPRDERLAEALATGGLASSGVVAALTTITGIYLAASLGDVGRLIDAAGDIGDVLVLLACFPIVAGALAFGLTGMSPGQRLGRGRHRSSAVSAGR